MSPDEWQGGRERSREGGSLFSPVISMFPISICRMSPEEFIQWKGGREGRKEGVCFLH